MRVPDLFIIGAMRSGTTTLFELLGRCDGVFTPDLKEPHYWAFNERPDYSGPGDDWLNDNVVVTPSRYRALYQAASADEVCVEASAMYLYLPHAIRRILDASPDARFLALLRDPAERAYSAFTYQVGRNREPERDFAVALDLEEERRQSGYAPIWHYRRASEYGRQLRVLSEIVPDRQLLLLSTGELAQRPAEVLRQVLDHCGATSVPVPDDVRIVSHSSRWPSGSGVDRLLFPPERVARRLRPLARGPVRALAETFRRRNTEAVPPLPADIRAALDQHFAADLDGSAALAPFMSEWGLAGGGPDHADRS